ncbi:MAG: hypothetical protein AAB594_02315 [Patescibacteria group bacterium]
MEGVIVHGESFDSVVIDWEEEATREEVMAQSHKWLTTHNFLTSRMNGLNGVSESSLTIEPAEE